MRLYRLCVKEILPGDGLLKRLWQKIIQTIDTRCIVTRFLNRFTGQFFQVQFRGNTCQLLTLCNDDIVKTGVKLVNGTAVAALRTILFNGK